VADLGAWQTWERGKLVNRGILVVRFLSVKKQTSETC